MSLGEIRDHMVNELTKDQLRIVASWLAHHKDRTYCYTIKNEVDLMIISKQVIGNEPKNGGARP